MKPAELTVSERLIRNRLDFYNDVKEMYKQKAQLDYFNATCFLRVSSITGLKLCKKLFLFSKIAASF